MTCLCAASCHLYAQLSGHLKRTSVQPFGCNWRRISHATSCCNKTPWWYLHYCVLFAVPSHKRRNGMPPPSERKNPTPCVPVVFLALMGGRHRHDRGLPSCGTTMGPLPPLHRGIPSSTLPKRTVTLVSRAASRPIALRASGFFRKGTSSSSQAAVPSIIPWLVFPLGARC